MQTRILMEIADKKRETLRTIYTNYETFARIVNALNTDNYTIGHVATVVKYEEGEDFLQELIEENKPNNKEFGA